MRSSNMYVNLDLMLPLVNHDHRAREPRDINNLVFNIVWNPLEDKDKPRRLIIDDKLSPPSGHLSLTLLWSPSGNTRNRNDVGWESSMRCAVELKEAGIHLHKCYNTHVTMS